MYVFMSCSRVEVPKPNALDEFRSDIACEPNIEYEPMLLNWLPPERATNDSDEPKRSALPWLNSAPPSAASLDKLTCGVQKDQRTSQMLVHYQQEKERVRREKQREKRMQCRTALSTYAGTCPVCVTGP